MQGRIDLLTKIREAIYDQLRETCGQRFALRQLCQHSTIKKWFSSNSMLANNAQDMEIFKKHVREAIKTPYSMKDDIIQRSNLYSTVKDIKSLEKAIPLEGILVDDEILKFTYPDVLRDINILLERKALRKLMHSSTDDKKLFFLFPNPTSNFDPVHLEYDTSFYLQISQAFVNKAENGGVTEERKKKNTRENYQADLNYKLPGFKQLKEEWLKCNGKK